MYRHTGTLFFASFLCCKPTRVWYRQSSTRSESRPCPQRHPDSTSPAMVPSDTQTPRRADQASAEHSARPVQLSELVQRHVVPSAVGGLAYIPNYVSEEEEQRLLRDVYASKASWTQLSGRRLQNHGGVVHSKGLLQSKIPSWLAPLTQRLHTDTSAYGDQPPNHVLVNAYRPGEGIMPHEDGPSYWPGVCILSLAAPAVIRFWRKQADQGAPSVDGRPDASLLLLPRSLLVFTGEAYTDCLHGIREVTSEALDDTVANLAQCLPHITPSKTSSLSQATNPPQASASSSDPGPTAETQTDTVAWGTHAGGVTGSQDGLEPHAGTGVQGVSGSSQSDVRTESDMETQTDTGSACIMLPRERERISLTVRRVTKVFKGVVRLGAR